MKLPDLTLAEGFEWDSSNQAKVEKRMLLAEAEAAFLGEPLVFFDEAHSSKEQRWFLMNRVGSHLVFLVFTMRRKRIRIISARYMHGREVKKYGKKID